MGKGERSSTAAKLSPETQAAICESIRKCNTVEGAARKAGISDRTLRAWRQKGRDGIEPYVGFELAITRAEEEAKEVLLNIMSHAVDKDGNQDWRAADALLTKRYWREYGKKHIIMHEVQAGIEEILDAVEKRMTRGAYLELIEALAAVQGVHADEAEQARPSSNGAGQKH